MTKTELIKALAARTGASQRAAAEFLDALVGLVVEAVKNGEEVRVAGLGKFVRNLQKGGKRRVPNSDRVIDVPDKYVPRFRPAKQFKDAVA